MKTIKIYVIILILVLLVILNIDYINIYISDIYYIFNKSFSNNIKINENLAIENISNIKNNINNIKMIILSFDNRKTIDYIEDHNKNIKNYCNNWKNIDYQYTDFCNKNVYWNKLYLVLEKLLTNNYEFVMWMDTDSMFVNQDIDIRNILLLFNSDIFISHDNGYANSENVLNAGVFIIKNSINGINFLKESISYFEDSKCLNDDNSLKGVYAARCYEQGTINDLIFNKYYKYTTILSTDIILNTSLCNEKSFILHKYGGNKHVIKSGISNDQATPNLSSEQFLMKDLSGELNNIVDIKTCFNKINKINNII
jgi:hypothetical protein